MAENQLNNPYRILIPKEKVPEGEQPKVRQSAYIVGRNHRVAALGRILDIESPRLAIVFARTRNEVDELAESLRGRGYSVEPLHGGLDQAQRDRVMKRARAEQVDVIVATDVAARGIDIEHLTHVINYGIPATTETYVHRIGRTGRAGREGTAITILEPRESRLLKNIERMTKQKIQILSVPTATDVHANAWISQEPPFMKFWSAKTIWDAIVLLLKLSAMTSTSWMLQPLPSNWPTKTTGRIPTTLKSRARLALRKKAVSQENRLSLRAVHLKEWFVCSSVPAEIPASDRRIWSAPLLTKLVFLPS